MDVLQRRQMSVHRDALIINCSKSPNISAKANRKQARRQHPAASRPKAMNAVAAVTTIAAALEAAAPNGDADASQMFMPIPALTAIQQEKVNKLYYFKYISKKSL